MAPEFLAILFIFAIITVQLLLYMHANKLAHMCMKKHWREEQTLEFTAARLCHYKSLSFITYQPPTHNYFLIFIYIHNLLLLLTTTYWLISSSCVYMYYIKIPTCISLSLTHLYIHSRNLFRFIFSRVHSSTITTKFIANFALK